MCYTIGVMNKCTDCGQDIEEDNTCPWQWCMNCYNQWRE